MIMVRVREAGKLIDKGFLAAARLDCMDGGSKYTIARMPSGCRTGQPCLKRQCRRNALARPDDKLSLTRYFIYRRSEKRATAEGKKTLRRVRHWGVFRTLHLYVYANMYFFKFNIAWLP